MISFSNFINGWNKFFYEETDATTLCLFRFMFGFFLFLNGAALMPDFEVWFGVGNNSLVPLRDSFTYYRDFRINIFKWMAPTEAAAWFVLIGYTMSAFFLTIGFKTRISSIVCFIFLVSLQNRNYAILNSGDTIMRCMLFMLMMSPCHVMYSVDAYLRKEKGTPYSTQVSYVTIRLLQLQFSLVYFATTLFKLKGFDWVEGTAIYYTSRLVNFQRIPLPILFDYVFLVKFFTWSALLVEFAMGTLIWVKEFRIWVLLAGLALHLGIEISMSIGFFEWIMMVAYVLFLEPKEISFIKEWVKNLSLKKFGRA